MALGLEMLEVEGFHNIAELTHNLEILATLLEQSQMKDLSPNFLTKNTSVFLNFFGNY